MAGYLGHSQWSRHVLQVEMEDGSQIPGVDE